MNKKREAEPSPSPYIMVRLTPKQKADIESAADKAGFVRVAEWARQALLAAAAPKKAPAYP